MIGPPGPPGPKGEPGEPVGGYMVGIISNVDINLTLLGSALKTQDTALKTINAVQ